MSRRITFAHTCEHCGKHTCDSRYIETWKLEWDESLYDGGMVDLDGKAISGAIGKPCNCQNSPSRGEYVKGYEFAVVSESEGPGKKGRISFDSYCKGCTLPLRGRGCFIRSDLKLIYDRYGLVNVSQCEKIKKMISLKPTIGGCQCTYEKWDPVFVLAIIH